jgi:hypothetical protein
VTQRVTITDNHVMLWSYNLHWDRVVITEQLCSTS